jgi:hypothetical protein
MLAPTLDTKLEGTNSAVYCPTLEIAWDGLERIVGGPIAMQKQDDLVQRLNDANCPTGVVPEDAHVAMAGYTDQGIVPKIEAALRKTFGAGGGSSKPRRFLFDRPFLLTLWKKEAKKPYLAVWIASSDILIPFKKDERKAQQQRGREVL